MSEENPEEKIPDGIGDEQNGGSMSLELNVDDGENMTKNMNDEKQMKDPAILLEIKETTTQITTIRRYGRDELLKLKDVPLSLKKPVLLQENVSCLLNFDRRKSETPTENGSRNNPGGGGDSLEHRGRRPNDPRERLRKENDGIVLSPQRRSFNSGCFVPGRTSSNRSHSPLGGPNGGPNSTNLSTNSSSVSSMKENNSSSNSSGLGHGSNRERRIGSGRILRGESSSSWGDAFGGNDQLSSSQSGKNHGDDGNDYMSFRPTSQRTFGRSDYESSKSGGRTRYEQQRRRMADRDEEPEWFSGGPSSQNDTIELRGFEESDKPLMGRKKMQQTLAGRRGGGGTNAALTGNKKKNETQTIEENDEKKSDEIGTKQTSTTNQSGQQQNVEKNGAGGDDKIREQLFNLDEMLKCDTIPGLHGLLANGVAGDGDNNTKSRFTQWFSTDNPSKTDSRRSSVQENAMIKSFLKDIGETNVTIPPDDSNSYFAPISPAAATGGAGLANVIGGAGVTGSNLMPNDGKQLNIMEMLQRSNNQTEIDKSVAGRMLNLDELEAKMRQTEVPPPHNPMHKPKSAEDMAAFKQLLAQVIGNTNQNKLSAQQQPAPPPPSIGQPMSLMEMLSHSQQQDEAQARIAAHQVFEQLQQAQLQARHKQQVEMLSKIMNVHGNGGGVGVPSGGMQRTSPLPDISLQQSRELLNRPEAQAILRGLKRGDITPQHIYQQLANPALQPRHHDMLVTILKMYCGGGVGTTNTVANSATGGGGGGIGLSPRVLSPVPPLYHQQPQQPPNVLQQQHNNVAAGAQQTPPQQLCVSPLPPNAYCVSPILATSPNTLTVPAMHQRIPSPRELQVHTQNILQRALIKKKLEEQQENYRKKQEMQQQQRVQSPNTNNNNSGNGGNTSNNNNTTPKSVSSPTPLAFTPTSVLRKMTAEKEESKDLSTAKIEIGKGRPLTGVRQTAQQQQVAQQQSLQNFGQWAGFQNVKQGVGRPIVKANNNYTIGLQQQEQQQCFNQLQQQRTFATQQQQRKNIGGSGGGGGGGGMHVNQLQYPLPSVAQQFTQQLLQQRLRAQHQQHSRTTNNVTTSSTGQQSQLNNSTLNYGNQQSAATGTWQQFMDAQQQSNRVRGAINDGELSPTTSNQLARWFSPDLLEKARVGELPSTAGLAQHALSLEEIERQTAPPVHN